MTRRKKKVTKTENVLIKTLVSIKSGEPEPPPKEVLGFRCDPKLKAEAKKVFGNDLPQVLEAALRQALNEEKKL
jgi:hypothetical protein